MVHPNTNEGFEWDSGNEDHLFLKGIAFWEAEEVYWNGPVWAKDKKGVSGDYYMFGHTESGRKLTLIVKVNEVSRTIRVITGWDSTKGERSRYFNE